VIATSRALLAFILLISSANEAAAPADVFISADLDWMDYRS
jgi:hypothetical protein